MPKTPDDPAVKDGIGFFQRWSERKANAASEPVAPEDDTAPSAEAPSTAETEVPPQVTEADLENLTYDSDFTKFMGEHVPEALRRRALRQLWRSDPILANIDGLCDYDDDYTDAALVVQALQTTHKVGQGYLSDDEVAANQARGEPKQPATADEANAQDKTELAAETKVEEPGIDEMDDDGEDIESFDDQGGKAETQSASPAEPVRDSASAAGTNNKSA